MNRRNFIKSTCTYCVGAIGLGIVAAELSSCALSTYTAAAQDGIITVPLSSFKTDKLLIVRNNLSDFEILVVKKSETDFQALLMKCTHKGSPLNASKNGFVCPKHGAKFDLEGNVTREPAALPLKKYPIEIKNGNIQIAVRSS